MASKPLTERLCGLCENKARTLCYECHIFLCETCSNFHKQDLVTKDHNLIELEHLIQKKSSQNDPSISKRTSKYFNEDELASDFLEIVTLTDDTVLYRGAKVAVESTSVTKKTSKQTDPTQLKATRCLEFSVKRPEDKENVNVRCVLCVADNVVVVDNSNNVLKLFDQSGTYLSSTKLKGYTCGITCVSDSKFATCGINGTVYLWTVRGQTIDSEDVYYHENQDAHGIYYNGTYYSVLHSDYITILDRQGRQVRQIIMKEACGKSFMLGWEIHMDSDTNNIYVPCWNEDGVLCMTIEGQALWFTSLSVAPWSITEIQGTLCVADYGGDCLHLITKELKYVRKLLDKDDLGGKPDYICYGQDSKLYVSYVSHDDKHHIISVYSVS